MLNVLPRDEKYFERFTEMAQRIHESAKILDQFFDKAAPVSTVADQIKRLEHECDEISHDILRGIDRTFITPIDREDIHRLAVRLDDVIDLIDGTVRRLSVFNISEPTPAGRKLSAIIVQATGEMVEAVGALRKQKGVIDHCIRIKRERRGHRLPGGDRIAVSRADLPDRSHQVEGHLREHGGVHRSLRNRCARARERRPEALLDGRVSSLEEPGQTHLLR
ncbi:MAG: DUF47 domain-containing protein [Acidobacteria bacterium]|nr:MAG: DUF47 domain-containing protein [Acidobacteriota bacterium]